MMKKYVILLVSLFFIWGLASCEKSDSDEKEAQPLKVHLSKNEVFA